MEILERSRKRLEDAEISAEAAIFPAELPEEIQQDPAFI